MHLLRYLSKALYLHTDCICLPRFIFTIKINCLPDTLFFVMKTQFFPGRLKLVFVTLFDIHDLKQRCANLLGRGGGGGGLQPLMWAGSQAGRVKITVIGASNHLSYCMIL